ncbi:MAG: ABC-2 transporter permease [Candidatus Delongbacteria bacterium]|jgi:hypothetical protein|nr:ABC-2 transporter permease [Candidatus Delongbacteria bacterium]
MYKLIITDLKVLGHRIWAIPVGVFLFILMFSFIPYLNQVQSFQNWIFAILIPGLLTFELFREEQKNNTGSILMTMPISKEEYVWSKYQIIIGFVFISLIVGFLSDKLQVFRNEEINSLSHDIIHANEWIMMTVMMALPVYFFTRKLKLSMFLGISVFFTILLPYFILHSDYFVIYIFSNDIGEYIMKFCGILAVASIIHLVIKIRFKSISNKIFLTGWFSIVLYLTVNTISYLINFVFDIKHYMIYKNLYANKIEELSVEQITLYKKLLEAYHSNFIGITILSIVLIIALIIIHRRTKDKFYQHCVLFIFLPILVTILNQFLSTLIEMNFIQSMNLNLNATNRILLRKITMIPGLLIMIYYSAKASIYLLKNNRTLK